MQRDWGHDDGNKQPISDDDLSSEKADPGEIDRANETPLSKLLEPTPVDPQRMVQVDKFPLFIPGKCDRDLTALVPFLSTTLQDRVPFEKTSDEIGEKMPSRQSLSVARRRPRMEQQFHPPSEPLASPSQDSTTDQSTGQIAGRCTQVEQWNTRFQQLVEFQKEFHHCCVPLNYSKNSSLAHWVKRQRYQYRVKLKEGKPSTLTDERQKALENLGFVWDSHAAAWEERWIQLNEFRQHYGHSRVPKNYPPNPQLAVWVKCQRRQFKLYRQGLNSNMTLERVEKLRILNFVFDPRSGAKK
ncbi:unnamed protein product [Cylindrotheca closterium]|uniref:Helicase-associated domain-containing protein n=1 Tax=Cylindrotheca closterium TaxID=2856 RepID=A0AAD2CHA1_9STRA|nr:unnamed protein product [Cylindrotheca closterium]